MKIWTRFTWKPDGDSWRLYYDRRKFGRVVPDTEYRVMWRSILYNGGLSNIANLTRARDATMRAAMRELEYEQHQQAARRHPIPSEIEAVSQTISSHSDLQGRSATTLHESPRKAASYAGLVK